MATAIRLEVLPARQGDCLLVECLRDGAEPWRMLLDGGPPDTWPLLEARLAPDPRLDVAVITHIDSDHIGGMIPYLQSPLAAHAADVWFNGRPHLPGLGTTRSVAQGESVIAALAGPAARAGTGPAARWNAAFGGGAIDTGEEGGYLEHVVPDGPRITVLSPTTKRLTALATLWAAALDDARRGPADDLGVDTPPPLSDLEPLADAATGKDGSVPNGASIALLVEHRGASLVLGADAYGTVLGAGLKGVAAARGLDSLPVDAFKLPHHGSKGNVLRALVAAAPARHYVVSSNGDLFHHPDDQAVARVVLHAPPGPTLWFNYDNARTRRWADSDLRARYGYDVRYPTTPGDGIVLELEERA
ncbi:hypothetical protein SAMN04489867_1226 [Pedococcus dokdonensis]|uniref:Metallo-beta-lactamase domain-containing protein n=1 Tax=Pedococcus dokdonensis TaxID=443156 RepID=A0A1H0PEE9_9MICO|nr:MBL fold metallo-hydrolase [Pedococcus dokdonensis]SDP03028.1 hypothetical protein SAMN04489867_1226 [Pedococcus dokdonensis]